MQLVGSFVKPDLFRFDNRETMATPCRSGRLAKWVGKHLRRRKPDWARMRLPQKREPPYPPCPGHWRKVLWNLL